MARGHLFKKEEPGGPITDFPNWAQVILGFILALAALLGLIVGLTRIWIWFDANYAHRQVSYQTSRIFAGRPFNYSEGGPAESYIDISGADTTYFPQLKYRPLDLTNDWVFRGTPSGQVGWPNVIGPGGVIGRPATLSTDCMNNCYGASGCGSTPETFDVNCTCYVQCACRATIGTSVSLMRAQVIVLTNQAQYLRQAAQGMRDAADDCNEPWEFCWWGTFGKTAREMRQAASKLDDLANKLSLEATKLNTTANSMEACCNETTAEAERACLDAVSVANCNDLVSGWRDAWVAEIANLNGQIAYAQSQIAAINDDGINRCESFGYYEPELEACCQAYQGWGRNCYAPTTNCDEDCLSPASPCYGSSTKCGLAELAARIQLRIGTQMTPRIALLNQAITQIAGCCSRPTAEEQWECILDAAP